MTIRIERAVGPCDECEDRPGRFCTSISLQNNAFSTVDVSMLLVGPRILEQPE